MFAALQVGAPFGYADAGGAVAWAALGSGIGLVTLLRLVQVGRRAVEPSSSNEPDQGACPATTTPDPG